MVANQDGGAHIGEEQEDEYYNLRNKYTMNDVFVINGIENKVNDHLNCSIRQIAHEILKSLDNSYTCKYKIDKIGFLALGAMIEQGAEASPIPQHNPKTRKPIRGSFKPPVNSPCPCGSGKKYKKCCGKK